MMKRGAAALLMVAVALSACGPGEPVDLMTADEVYANEPNQPGCYTSGTEGELVVDERAGTAILEDPPYSTSGRRVIVIWPPGYTARRSGSEVEVFNRDGKTKAKTGTHVNLMGGYPPHPEEAFLACGLELIE
jgi:hypothetical protein